MNKFILFIGIASIFIVGGCSTQASTSYSPSEIVTKAVEDRSNLKGFYMKGTYKITKGGKTIDRTEMEQWQDYERGNIKVISKNKTGEKTQSLNDGSSIIFYNSSQNNAFKTSSPQLSSEWVGSNQREQIQQTLNQTMKSHNMELVGEEAINGKDTYHLKATPKESNSIRGEEEYWISKESWMIMKSISKSGDVQVDYTVSELTLNPSFEEGTFTLDIPKDVDTKSLDESNLTKSITLEQAEEALGQSILQVTDKSYERLNIEKYDSTGFNRTEVSMEYIKDNKLQFALSVFPAPEEDDEPLPNIDLVEVRGTEGEYMSDGIQNLSWNEKGLRYSLLAQNNNLAKNELIQIAEQLQYK
ncbi:outer membrane lipoprotein carrier protein LolA [Pontibacillus salicampi]|uniref:Outer membrane lipoprotein carrier protein LolA n=1 Tax=Pontibacillus salicampi TaxID=1449801 RepID=A0ABV6LM24_9BACI